MGDRPAIARGFGLVKPCRRHIWWLPSFRFRHPNGWLDVSRSDLRLVSGTDSDHYQRKHWQMPQNWALIGSASSAARPAF